MIRHISKALTYLTLALVAILGVETAPLAQADVIVFAAASTTNAITEIAALYEAEKSGHITPSFASSSTLAKQIGNGAPANIYLSANIKWMHYLEKRKLIAPKSRSDLLTNAIVLIAPRASTLASMKIGPGFSPLAALGHDGRLALGDPGHVPAGIYGKKALQTLGSWEQVKNRLAPMKDVRAALVLVERGEVPLGLVYATDAAISKKVRVVGTFPSDCHSAIIYPVAAVAENDTPEAREFLDFLHSPTAQAVFKKYGFGIR